MTLMGKGYYMWQIPRCDGGVPSRIAARAADARLSHVLIKIADGSTWPYNYDFDQGIDLVPPVRDALRERGVEVWGWHYVRGDDPIGEARLAIKRTQELRMDGYVIDAEAQYKDRAKTNAARRFMQELRAGLPKLPIALSSYRYPQVHPDLPYSAFLEGCDYAMPQVYFEGSHNAEQQLQRSVEQYLSLSPARPVIPTAPTYSRGSWRPSPEEITRFFNKAQELGLSAANAWSWDYATRPEHLDLWQAVADVDWDGEPPVADIAEQLVGRWNQRSPDHVVKLYAQRAAHVTGARTVIGRAPIREWYQILFTQLLPNASFRLTGRSGGGNSRRFTWAAESANGIVFDGNDTLGILNDKIQYHYTYFTIRA